MICFHGVLSVYEAMALMLASYEMRDTPATLALYSETEVLTTKVEIQAFFPCSKPCLSFP